MPANRYDVIIVGAGAGGGVVAGVLAEAGKRVLLLERGRALSFADVGRDHLRNQRLSQYGHNAGPEGPGQPRVIVDWRTGKERIIPLAHMGGYGNNAATVGGGTLVYGAQAWRFHPLDFKMASTYGVPAGSSLADWPITHEELAPYYEKAEWELGVAGDHTAMTHLPAYNRPYPMPPHPTNLQGQVLRRGLSALGWDALPPPLAVNTEPRGGRAACIRCQHCVGFACPTDAKNGTQNTLIPRALATGRCDLVTEAMAEKIETVDGRAVGVSYWNAAGERITERADVIVVAGGAVESPRLLLNSGLGNDIVGRNLQGHYYPTAFGRFEEEVWDGLGPGPSTATCRWVHHDGGVIGGAMLADDFVTLPIHFWKGKVAPGVPRWGEEAKAWMRHNYRRVTDVKGPVQEIPSPEARVTLDPEVRDKWGIPVARLSGATHEETVRTAAFVLEKAKEWLWAAGAAEVWGGSPGRHLSGGQHQAGTIRMGEDPATSAADTWCRLHGHDNVYIGDGSVHVTNGAFNPFLTIMSLAFRTAEHITQNW